MDNRFRSAAFGGFNRQDVIEYLERSAREHKLQLEQLQGQVESAQQESERLEAKVQELAGQHDELAARAQQAERLPALEEEVRRLRELVARLEPDAAAYAAIKERAATMELEAHQRAQAIVDQAKNQAAQVTGEAKQWLNGLRREYGDLRLQVENTVAHATADLDRVRQGLGNVTLCMDRQKNAVDQFLRAAEPQE